MLMMNNEYYLWLSSEAWAMNILNIEFEHSVFSLRSISYLFFTTVKNVHVLKAKDYMCNEFIEIAQ